MDCFFSTWRFQDGCFRASTMHHRHAGTQSCPGTPSKVSKGSKQNRPFLNLMLQTCYNVDIFFCIYYMNYDIDTLYIYVYQKMYIYIYVYIYMYIHLFMIQNTVEMKPDFWTINSIKFQHPCGGGHSTNMIPKETWKNLVVVSNIFWFHLHLKKLSILIDIVRMGGKTIT